MLKSRGRNCEPLNLAPGFQTFLRGVLHTLDCVTKHVHFKVLRGILRIGAEQREGSAASAESRAQRRRPTVSAFRKSIPSNYEGRTDSEDTLLFNIIHGVAVSDVPFFPHAVCRLF